LKTIEDLEHFVRTQTGPWEGPGSWCYLIACNCGLHEIRPNRDEAQAVVSQHHRDHPFPYKAKPRKAVSAAKKAARNRATKPEQEPEWEEEFF
jgi:hypothetical protein